MGKVVKVGPVSIWLSVPLVFLIRFKQYSTRLYFSEIFNRRPYYRVYQYRVKIEFTTDNWRRRSHQRQPLRNIYRNIFLKLSIPIDMWFYKLLQCERSLLLFYVNESLNMKNIVRKLNDIKIWKIKKNKNNLQT